MRNRRELAGSGALSYSKNGISGTRLFECPWDERFASAPPIGEPHPHDDRAVCLAVDFAPIQGDLTVKGPGTGSDISTGGYERCHIVAHYGMDLEMDGLPVESFEIGCDCLQIGEGRLWSDGEESEDSDAVIYPKVDWTFRRRISEQYWERFKQTLFDSAGCVNAFAWNGAAAGCCLFNGAQSHQIWDFRWGQLTRAYDVIYSITYRRMPHNYFWRSDIGDWDYYQQPVYPPINFAFLGL